MVLQEMPMKDLNIVIVNFKMREDVMKLTDSLFADLEGVNKDVQITVVDNSLNEDGIHDELRAQNKGVKYIDAGGNIGFGRANEIGFKATPATYYLTLNPDTVIPSGRQTVLRLLQFMDDHKQIGCVGPKLLNMDGTLQYTCYRFDLSSILIKPFKHIGFGDRFVWAKRAIHRLEMRDFDHESTRPVDWIQGAAMMIRADAVKDVGWFDDRYFMYFEDCDWCRSLWDAGWPVYYVHDIEMYHKHTRGSSHVAGALRAVVKNKLARTHLRSMIQYLLKWKGHHKYYGAIK